VLFNVGVVPFTAYALGRILDNEKAIHFGLELAATQLIMSIQVMAISMIPFHQRPIIERGDRADPDESIVNDLLRGQSSFPSGHMVGVSSLMFKGWEYYGWPVGIPATLATVLIGWARVQEAEHYIADVVGTVGMAGIASLAVSRTRDFWTRSALGKGSSAGIFFVPVIAENTGQLVVAGQF
jgi:undecaprenyl-diphosphatase